MSTEFAARMAEHAKQADARAATIRADLAKMGGWLTTAAAEVTVERLTKYAADVAAAGRSLVAAENLAADCRQAATLAATGPQPEGLHPYVWLVGAHMVFTSHDGAELAGQVVATPPGHVVVNVGGPSPVELSVQEIASARLAEPAADHPDASEADTHNQGRPVEWIGRDGASPGVLVCAVPSPPGSNKGAFGHGGRLICGFRLEGGPCSRHDEPGPARTGQDDTGPDRTDTGRMVADTGYPTAPANGPEAGQ